MKDETESSLTVLLKGHLEQAIPDGTDMWPVIRKCLASRNYAAEKQCRRRFGGLKWNRIKVLCGVMGVLVLVIGIYCWMFQPKSVNAKEILSKAQYAEVLGTNSGINSYLLTQKIDWHSNSGEFHAETHRWYQAPGRWRVESRWNGTAPESSGVITIVSNGISEWRKQGESVTICRADPQPETDDLTSWGRDGTGLTSILSQVGTLYPSPQLQEDESIAGRSAYVIDLGFPNRFSNSAPELNNGRRVIWVDKETYFLLKAVQYNPDDGSIAGVMKITSIQYNSPIDPGVFSFTPLSGDQVNDYRSGSRPAPTDKTAKFNGLAEVRKKASFPIFIPTEVPAGLLSNPPVLGERPTYLVRIDYHTKDGINRLTVLNGPAGSCLAADSRKTGEAIILRDNIAGHFIKNQPEFGGPIIWWEEDGSYVALSSPYLTRDELAEIANTMSPYADIR